MSVSAVAVKCCRACEVEKPIDDFARDKSRGSGRKSICRSCDSAKSARYYRENRDEVIARVSARSGGLRPERICARCEARPATSSRHRYCDECRLAIARRDPARARRRERERSKVRATSAERGYGADHQRAKRVAAQLVATGTVRCARGAACKHAVDGVPGLIVPGQKWDLGHVDGDRSRYAGPEHRECNRATAGRRRRTVSRQW